MPLARSPFNAVSNNPRPVSYTHLDVYKRHPLFTTNAIDEQPLPIYGDGMQMRDYQYVIDHCEGIDIVLHKGCLLYTSRCV